MGTSGTPQLPRPGSSRWRDAGVLPFAFVLVAVGVSALMVVVASSRPLSTLELTLFQVIAMGLGLWSSFVVGRQSARASAQDLVRGHARGAFRRLVSMYESLRRVAVVIEERRVEFSRVENGDHGSIPRADAHAALDVLEAHVISQIGTANDAMEDWRDIVPDEVEDIERRLRESSPDV